MIRSLYYKRKRRVGIGASPTIPRSIKPTRPVIAITITVLTVSAIYFLLPIWWLLMQVTKQYSEMLATPSLLPGSLDSLAINIRNTLTYDGGYFPSWVRNSLFYSGASALVGTFVSLSCGYAFAKFSFLGKRILFSLMSAGMLLPSALLTIPLFLFFNQLGITNTVWSIIIPGAVSPFGVFLAWIYCETVPDEIIEAARIDGASEVRIFATIITRLLSPAIVTIALFIFIATWNNFLLPLVMLRGKDLLPVTLGLYTWQNNKADILTAQVLTGSLLGVIPVVILFLALQRYWRAGLSQGAVKS